MAHVYFYYPKIGGYGGNRILYHYPLQKPALN